MLKIKSLSYKFLILFFITLLFIFISAHSYSKTIFQSLSNSFLRLHIIANSDTTEDQVLKYKIRDEILNYITPYFSHINSKEEAIQLLENNMDKIHTICTNVVSSNGYNYPVKIDINNSYFPRKTYGQITLPEGFYDALKIEIGSSTGQNWWCVMFPSLCILDSSNCKFANYSDEKIKQSLGSEEYSLIADSKRSNRLKIKFKLVEIFENL